MLVIFCAQREELVGACEEYFEGAGLSVDCRIVDEADTVLAWLCRFPIYTNKVLFPDPCLIVTDLSTSKGSGLHMIRWVREHREYSNVPIIVHGTCGPVEIQMAQDAGATICLPATDNCRVLCETIRQLLTR